MKNILFDKKFTESNQGSYNSGWDKAVKAYQEVTIEVLKEKFGVKESQNSELELELVAKKA